MLTKTQKSFSDYLRSKAGGLVPEENVRLLLNEKATVAAIYEALDWLLQSCQKDDLVYFYFSGHGDMENSTIYKLGFLLSYNTPRTNYINNAVRIEDLNNIANTLSTKTNARVILITDACHSGKLAGNENRGNFLVGEQLRTVLKNEIRITSSGPDQLSNEDKGWGGGRGVFSYYLVNGLKGLAEHDQDGIITVNEIRGYLDSSFSADALLAQKEHKQNPVIKGVGHFKLATIDAVSLASLQKETASSVAQPGGSEELKPLPKQPQAYFFEALEKIKPEEIFDFKKLNDLPKEMIPFAFIEMLPVYLKEEIRQENLRLLDQSLKENEYALQRFKNQLVVMLSDRGQEIINLYLDGDAAELERRRYYNVRSSGYDAYPLMFMVALKLTSPDNVLYRILEVKQHYFAGVATRLKLPTVKKPDTLIANALAELKKALALEENAAYIQNELGILYQAKKDYVQAEQYFLRATQIAPAWAIPWSNLVGLYATIEQHEKGIAAYEKAKEFGPDFQGTFVNGGLLYEKQNNLLWAEELFRKSIALNSRHYLPFERLGYVYMSTTQYALADSFFHEADIRKKGFHFISNDVFGIVSPAVLSEMMYGPCDIDTLNIGKNDVMSYFVWGVQSDTATAERVFKKLIAIDPANPLVFHYLGKLLYQQQRWQEADIIFNLAIRQWLDSTAFNQYCDSVSKNYPLSESRNCIIDRFRQAYYELIEDHYFLGVLYEKWNHFSEAEEQFRKIITKGPGAIGGYFKLWTLFENIQRYKDAEEVIQGFSYHDKELSENEMNEFYKRMLSRQPESGDWYYKAGVFLYRLAASRPDQYEQDKKVIKPDTDGKEFTGNATMPETPTLRSETLPGVQETFYYAPHITRPRSDGIDYLLKADSLLAADDDAIADVNYKMADLYVWMGVPEKASAHYQKSVDRQPGNAGTRLKLVDTYSKTYQFQTAMVQLDSLWKRKEINFPKQLMLATYLIHSGRSAEAQPLLTSARKIHPYRIYEIDDLLGRMHLLASSPRLALPYYKEYLMKNENDPLILYTIATVNARIGNQKEAWKWLELSINKGFNYSWVLQFDQAWADYRKLGKWNELQRRVRPQEYPGQDNF